MTDVIHHHIEIVAGPTGPKARIAGHRIRVQDVVIWHERMGLSPDEIVDQYPTITLADVHAALAYYWDHHDLVEQWIAAEHDLIMELRRQEQGPLATKLATNERVRDHISP
jgi:uncharacterized protein (DUF433 family)